MPLAVYRELCALVGQLSIFGASRRPPKLPEYDHDNLGPCFDAVIKHIETLMRPLGPRAFEKRYFEREGDQLRVDLERAWLSPTKKLFLGVESALEHEDCVRLLLSTPTRKSVLDIKMGSAGKVAEIFKQKLRGLTLVPITMPPKELPLGPSIVYFEIVRDNVFWRAVDESGTLGVKLNREHAQFKDSQTVTVTLTPSPDSRELKFALFVIDRK
jgi:type VI secretion system protein ImpJ